jgi:hypothetical protein
MPALTPLIAAMTFVLLSSGTVRVLAAGPQTKAQRTCILALNKAAAGVVGAEAKGLIACVT